MFLSKIGLSLSDPGIRSAMYDGQKMHRYVTGLFQTARKDNDILYCLREQGGTPDLYIYSAVPVDRKSLRSGMKFEGEKDLTEWLASFKVGETLGFQVRTAPFKKVAEEGQKNSRRRSLHTQEERLEWLARKAEQGGFKILYTEEIHDGKLHAFHAKEKGGELTVDVYRYSGMLQVTDEAAFKNSVCSGIGPDKAYGLGMLLLRRN